MRRPFLVLALCACMSAPVSLLQAQVYSPVVLVKGQVDASSLESLARGICARARAVTPRQKAEAIWRFFLTDGRFVAPGFWYHIAGWAYEEPGGEVLDPLRLLNSYGFGLCYQVAPLLEAVFESAGFEDARVWFLTGHTVTEVLYDGAYHYFDSDMMGYSTTGTGDPKKLPVASVSQIASDGSILLGKLLEPDRVDPARIDPPWYPADVKESAIGGLAELFTTKGDNWLFPSTRYPSGHTMDFVLRPGERITRFYQPESEGAFYLPFKFDGKLWDEFPREVAQYRIRTDDGPASQKDARRWATGRIEYQPPLSDPRSYHPPGIPGFDANIRIPAAAGPEAGLRRKSPDRPGEALFEVRSPYVLIDATVAVNAVIQGAGQSLEAAFSVDGGRRWESAAVKRGPFSGRWEVVPESRARAAHGSLALVGGRYAYLMRLRLSGPGSPDSVVVRDVQISSRFQLNPRTLPELSAGRNEVAYQPGKAVSRVQVEPVLERIREFALSLRNIRCVTESGQPFLWQDGSAPGELVFEVSAPPGGALNGFDAGARFLDLRDGLAPDKLTAEVRKTSFPPAAEGRRQAPRASLSWSARPDGPYRTLWKYSPDGPWPDGRRVDQVLRWPEVDRSVRGLPPGTRKVYVRYSVSGMGLDSPRLAALSDAEDVSSPVEITHQWVARGRTAQHVERIADSRAPHTYIVDTGESGGMRNHALVLYCPPGKPAR